jgi:predicted O-methyltransferase YrrM
MDKPDKLAVLEALLGEKVKLHFWEGEWQDGGLTDHMLRTLFELSGSVSDDQTGVILETGAGLSTLAFLASAPARVITIAPDPKLRDRIDAQIARFSLDGSRIDYYVDRSENVLPDLAKSDEPFVDVALIDGGHGMPTVFVDFCYINKILKQGGYLAIDDIQLHSVRQLYLLLKSQPGFHIVRDLGKLVVFQKTGNQRFLPEWNKQPFVVLNSC